MKRYISSIVIFAIIACTIGAFYIYSAVSANSLPEIKMVKESGNENAAKKVAISGNYHIGNTDENFVLTTKGIDYTSQRSFFERIDGVETGKLLELRKKYRNFMRGKHDIESIYEDQELLTYTELIPHYYNYKLDIFILNKKSKKKSSFTVDIPNYKQYSQVYFRDVQRVGNELKVITENNRVSDTDKNKKEVHVYTVDYINKKIIKDEIIASKPMENSHPDDQYYNPIQAAEPTIANKYYAMQDIKVKFHNRNDGEMNETIVNSEIVAYNYESNKVEKIKVPKQYYEAELVNDADGTIYLIAANNKEVSLSKVRMDKHSVENVKNISLPEMGENTNTLIKIKNGKMYIFVIQFRGNEKNTLYVRDIQTGDILYKGNITQLKQKKNSNIDLFSIEIN